MCGYAAQRIAAEVFFTASGTEGNNMALWGSVAASSIDHVITSSIEHHAVLQPLEKMRQAGQIQLHWVRVDAQGNLQYDHLEYLLKTHERVLVSLMHANNEIGNLNDLARIGALCQTYGAIFHTDAVQTIGHCMLDFQTLPVHLAVGSAHKFHGPQGSVLSTSVVVLRCLQSLMGGRRSETCEEVQSMCQVL